MISKKYQTLVINGNIRYIKILLMIQNCFEQNLDKNISFYVEINIDSLRNICDIKKLHMTVVVLAWDMESWIDRADSNEWFR